MKNFWLVLALCIGGVVQAQLKAPVGQSDFSDWKGIVKVKNNEGSFNSGDTITYRYPDGEKKYKGFREIYGNASDWSMYNGLSFEINLKKESTASLSVSFKVPTEEAGLINPVSAVNVVVTGAGWQSVYLPWNLFDLSESQRLSTLQAVKELDIVVGSPENSILQIRNVEVKKGKKLSLTAPIQGKSIAAGTKAHYEIEVGNTTAQKQSVQLVFSKYGWESMAVSVEPSVLELAPNEIKKCVVEVSVPQRLIEGVREKQVLKAIPNGDGTDAMTLELTTAVAVSFPYMVFTSDKWQWVRDKIEKYDWAKEGLSEYEQKASKWVVPEIANKLSGVNDYMGNYVFSINEGENMMNCAIAYQLTGKKEYAQKCALFLRRLSNVEKGYPSNFRANDHNFVKEGGFFQNVARGYDMVHNCEFLTAEDHASIENTFRLYIETARLGNNKGGTHNWIVSELAGALYCALAIQDWNLIDEFLHGPTGIYDQIANGVMSDGWWFECAIGYNLWVSSEFSEIAIALRPWGINLVDELIPIGTTPYATLIPDKRNAQQYGMNFWKWGTLAKNSVGIKSMWDALLPFLDYRGVMFANNDARETLVSGQDYELAYYLYRDPEYAAIIQRGNKRSLLYGIPELPNVTSEKVSKSAYADNIGVVQLRSQTKGREQREQIQAVLHYGSHGGGHGHFSRTNFLSMMRYGRSFYNPEMYWYGYSSFLYKFLVQTSINKNMVVVDQKMQEANESFRTLFYTGDMMQAAAVETKARWMYPAYGGLIYGGKEDYTLVDKGWEEGRSVFVPDDASAHGEITGYTNDSILQRRLMVMMDDYVILADYEKGAEVHTFDWLMQIKGFKSLSADKKEFVRHDNQMSTDPLGSAQFITDCNWYKTEGTSRAQFEMCWGKGCDNDGARMENCEDGLLKIDVFNAWPQQKEIMIGTAPESFGVAKQLWYTVKADDEYVVNDSTGAWILGSESIDVDITGKQKLTLTTKTPGRIANNTIFWGDAKLVLKDGSEIFVSTLPVKYENVLLPETKGLDYYDGPVKIAGELMDNSTPGMPENNKKEATITIDLSGLDVARFKAKIGGDFPLGDESSRRKTLAVRTHGAQTRYLSVIEPYETESFIKSVKAISANELEVELLDGRVQHVVIANLESDNMPVTVLVSEFVNGELVRQETTEK
jgi:hypothetical protein